MSSDDTDPEDIPLEESLLLCARRGQADIVRDILQSVKEGKIHVDINCKGTQKSNRGWTPLHLAAYFGHRDVAQMLLQYGANVDAVNNVGDTPLHRAAYTGRVDVVMLLLQFGADVNIVNAEGRTPKSLAKNDEIQRLIEATEQHEACRLEEEFMSSVRQGEVQKVDTLLTSGKLAKVGCTDNFGNTALHVAAQSGQKEVAVYLLQQGVSTAVKNNQGLLACDVAKTEQMKQLLQVKPKKDAVKPPSRFEGLLIKRNLIGKTPIWVVIERGVLSYFRNRGDAATGSKRRGMKYLDEADVMVHEENDHDFLVRFSDGTTHRLMVDPSAAEVRVGRDRETGEIVTRQMWLNALKSHTDYNTHYLHKGEARERIVDTSPVVTLQDAFKVAEAHQEVLNRQVSHISNYLTTTANTSSPRNLAMLEDELKKTVKYSKDMCKSLTTCLDVFTQEEEMREKALHEEQEKNRVLQEALHALAIEHHELERSYSHSYRARSYSVEDDEFYECDDDSDPVEFRHADARSVQSDAMSFKSCQFDLYTEEQEEEESSDTLVPSQEASAQSLVPSFQLQLNGRTCLPVPMFNRNDFSIWSILKQCIGKELSKITMPVVFNEPLTFLQRITEYLEYATLLDMACQQRDPADRMMYVAAFAVSAISSNWERIGKPFNPLLGETYELHRLHLDKKIPINGHNIGICGEIRKPDLGIRLVTEQVCHHPPISAFHVESKRFKFHGSIHPKLRFWGKSVEVNPKGVVTLELTEWGETYTWQNVNCCVHNVIVGKIWIEHTGVIEILNHKTRHKGVLNFKQGGWFGKDLHKVEGHVLDPEKRKVRAMYGSWVYDMFGVDYRSYEEYMKEQKVTPATTPKNATPAPENGGNKASDIEDNLPTHHFSTFNLNIPNQVQLWKNTPRPEAFEKYFSFTSFALCLNELKDGMLRSLPPTDSRLRPDVRLLEEGNIDLAGEEKNRIEEKQRAARRERKKKKNGEWTPVWFKNGIHPVTEKEDWLFTEQYWNHDWSRCPDIF